MTYISVQETGRPHGHKESVIDLPRFAADLAGALAALTKDVELLPPKNVEDYPSYPNTNQTIRIGTDHLELHANNWKRKVHLSIAAPDVKWNDRNTYAKDHKPEDAYVNPDGRKIEAIAKDVMRRVVTPSLPALKLQREYAQAQADARDNIVREADALKEKLPSFSVRVDVQKQSATLYSGTDKGHYITGMLRADGKVHIDRIDDLPVATFVKLVALLNSGRAK